MEAYNIYFTLCTTYQKINIKTNITSQSKTKWLIAHYAKTYAYSRPHTSSALFYCRGVTDDRYTETPSRIGDHAI